MTITIPTEMAEEAARRATALGTTPDLLLLDIVRRGIMPAVGTGFPDGVTAAEFFGPFLGVWDGPPTDYARDTGRKYADDLWEKYRGKEPR